MTGRHAAPPSGGPWTSHGHAVGGVTVVPDDPSERPPVARCGGPAICKVCAADAERIRHAHRPPDGQERT